MSSVICKDDQGAFIPATQRPDGSWRKPRRIKDGYVPQEEVPLYESRGKKQMQAAANHYPPGLHPDLIKKREMEKEKMKPVITYSPAPGVVLTQGGSTNEAKSKKKKKKKSGETNSGENGGGQPKQPTKSVESSQKPASKTADPSQKPASKSKSSDTSPKSADCSQNPSTDPVKRLKNLRKKLRDIEVMEQKMAEGQKDKFDKDQLEKVARKPDVLSEILALQLSIEGHSN
ncbi:partner of Y14 and mago [Nilaparvata lugens]|uniref:partner of Y14 and mago n=1 Tax=Nilaparvata lugens TaxID=108931 RepID=UPI00193CBF05|nr:partner of Y14 and mago [Nilaparvata lugens]